jgi:ribosomal protein L37E
MADQPAPAQPRRVTPVKPDAPQNQDKVLCERCASEMYRMHAVWRCSSCGFKTDCCGW